MSLVCREIFNEVCILGNGDVVCSCIDSMAIRILGNIKHNSVYKIFMGKDYSDLRKQILATEDDTYCPSLGLNCGFKTVPVQNINTDEAILTIDKIRIETYSYCNLRCPSCIVPSLVVNQQSRVGKLPIDKIREVLIDTKDTLKDIYLYNYGEPFMDKRFLDVLRLARQIVPNARIYTHTNGTIIPPGWLETIVQEELLDYISFSIDGASQNTYGKYRIGGRFDIAFKNMTAILNYKKELRKLKPDVEWQYILFEWNDSDEELHRAQQLAAEHGLCIRWILTSTDGKSLKIMPESEKYQSLLGRKIFSSDLYASMKEKDYEEFLIIYKDMFSISKNDEFLAKAYLDILGREPDTEGFDHYISMLDSDKMSRRVVVASLSNQREMEKRAREELLATYADLIVIPNDSEFLVKAYLDILGREPDIEGFDHYLSMLDSGKMSKEVVVASLSNSKEIEKRAQEEILATYADLLAIPNDSEFLVQVYLDILGRKPDKEGFDYYVSMLDNGKVSKETIIELLLNSDEI